MHAPLYAPMPVAKRTPAHALYTSRPRVAEPAPKPSALTRALRAASFEDALAMLAPEPPRRRRPNDPVARPEDALTKAPTPARTAGESTRAA